MFVVQSFLLNKNSSVFEILYVVLQLQFCLMYVPVCVPKVGRWYKKCAADLPTVCVPIFTNISHETSFLIRYNFLLSKSCCKKVEGKKINSINDLIKMAQIPSHLKILSTS